MVELKEIRVIPTQEPLSISKLLSCDHLQKVDENYTFPDDSWDEESPPQLSPESSGELLF